MQGNTDNPQGIDEGFVNNWNGDSGHTGLTDTCAFNKALAPLTFTLFESVYTHPLSSRYVNLYVVVPCGLAQGFNTVVLLRL